MTRGGTRIWAAGAIYAVGRVNFLFGSSQDPHLTDQLTAALGVVKTTMANKSARKTRRAPEVSSQTSTPAPHDQPAQLDATIDEMTVDAHNDDEQLSGFLVGIEDALGANEPASIVGIEVQVISVDAGPGVRSGLTARVSRDGTTYEVALADLQFKVSGELGPILAAYRHWQGRRS